MRLRRRRTEDGAVAVEFALVLVFVLLPLVFGIIDFGYLFAQNLALNNASRQAARYAAVETRTCADVEAEAVSSTAPLVELTADDVTIERTSLSNPCAVPATDQPCKGSIDKDNVTVTLTYEATILIPVVPGLGNTKTLHGTGVFRCEFF
jgi:Flp pilus assembly protein TadG